MMNVRSRLTEGITRARLSLELKRSLRPGIVILVGAVATIAMSAYIASQLSETLLSGSREVRFEVKDVTGVVAGQNEVRFRGVAVGDITKVEREDGRPVLTVKLRSDVGPIYRNATAELRPNTALQDMYLNVTDRGSEDAGEASTKSPVPVSQTTTGVSINDVLSVFRASARTRLGTLLDQLGNGLDDRGARLRSALAELAPTLRTVGRISDQLDARRPLVRRLVRNTSVLTGELADQQGALSTLVEQGSSALGALKDSSGDLAATLDELPPTIAAADSSFAAVRGVLGDVDTAVTRLTPVAGHLPDALDDVRALADAADPAVTALRDPVKRLVPLSRALRPVSNSLATSVRGLRPQVADIDKFTDVAARCEIPIQRFFQWNASFTKFGDVRAPSPRGQLVVGLGSTGVVKSPFEQVVSTCAPGKSVGGRPITEEDNG
ncbi:hypothetical protein DSM112329_04224 [Paraconexibacter sp. AEG42_29]|uniref:Mce/MlaD domain-containing protein n=1 Tax=Paraconexibacter sp. AEG42_29 TaxID=2997339 RepID=A0AAU7B065_9ACTN